MNARGLLLSGAMLIALAAGGGLLLLLTSGQSNKPDSDVGQVLVQARDAPHAPALPRPQPTASAALIQTPPAGVADALGLDGRAAVRGLVRHDITYDILCGEVSREGSPDGYKRFFYVGAARSAEIDDGSPEFEQRTREVCKRQP